MVVWYGIALCVIAAVWKKGKGNNKEVLLMLAAGCVLAMLLWVKGQQGGQISETGGIERNPAGGKNKRITVVANQKEKQRDMELEISARAYTEEELEFLFSQLLPELDTGILGENESLEKVCSAMRLPERVDGYPFSITWESSRPEILSADGKPGESVPPEGSLVRLNACITCEENNFSRNYAFYAQIFPEQQEDFFARLYDFLQEMEAEDRAEAVYYLPDRFEGREVLWKEKKKNDSFTVFLLAGVGAAAIQAGKRKEKEKEEKRRKKMLERKYPEIACKTALFIGAGMTVQKAVRKLAKDNPEYEELAITCRELDSGVAEAQAYQNLGRRTGLPCYIRYGALLSQHVKKGASGLRNALQEEAETALKERKERARRLGEEAGTKLLGPMMVLLVIVMTIIMIPAFSAFSL